MCREQNQAQLVDWEGAAGPPQRGDALAEAAMALVVWYLSGLVVLLGVYAGYTIVPLWTEHPASARRADFLSSFAAWDGTWYVQIVEQGYSHRASQQSNVAFFPAYPALAALVRCATRWRPESCLLIVSQAALAGALVLLQLYVRARQQVWSRAVARHAVLAAAFFPTTFFFRMTYSESLFLCSTLLAMYAMERRWNTLVIALIVGFATATRPIGMALIAPLVMHLCDSARCRQRSVGMALVVLPVALWGIAAYMLFQWIAFGDALAFIKTQEHWSERPVTMWEATTAILAGEPIRAVYDPQSICYWSRVPPRDWAVLNLKFANPIYFVLTALLISVGASARWLNRREIALSILLLLIPLWLQGARMCMSSQARFAAAVFPAYVVLGHIASRLPSSVTAALLGLGAATMCLYSAMFASWQWYY